jgi:hypothetical protein
VNCVAVLPDGNLVSGSADKTLRLWSYLPKKKGQILRTLQLAMGKNELGRTFHSPNFGMDASENASILHKMPRDPRGIIGSFLGAPANTRTNPERKANRAFGTSNYKYDMELLKKSYNMNGGFQNYTSRKNRALQKRTITRKRK